MSSTENTGSAPHFYLPVNVNIVEGLAFLKPTKSTVYTCQGGGKELRTERVFFPTHPGFFGFSWPFTFLTVLNMIIL